MSASEAELAMARLDALAACTDEAGRITRLAFSPALRRANDRVLAWMREADMAGRLDEAGNVFGRYEGEKPGAPAILIGSHLDTVRDGGRFDGPLGVVAGLAVVERLWRERRRLPLAIELIGFADEEGVRFGATVLGSAAVAGRLPANWRERPDADGVTAAEALRDFGLDPGGVAAASRRETPPLAYLELHIEQGPVLERVGAPLGCVTGIAGATRIAVTIGGSAGHAGTTPMGERRDALAAAAQCVLAVEELSAGMNGVGTVGQLRVAPNAGNVIPGEVRFSVDIRAAEDSPRKLLVEAVLAEFQAIASRRRTTLDWRTVSETRSTPCSPDMVTIIADVLVEMGLPVVRLASGAGHDGVAISSIAPIGMIFLRCAGGISHNPAESASVSDIAAGIEALYRVCRSASRTPSFVGNR
jgi:allantoate deiminase